MTKTNNTNANKKTMRDYYNELLQITEVANNAELVEFINGRLAQIDKRDSSAKTKTSKVNAKAVACRKDVLSALVTIGEPVTATDLLKATDLPYTIHEVVAALTAMRNDTEKGTGEVVRTFTKGKAYFTVA